MLKKLITIAILILTSNLQAEESTALGNLAVENSAVENLASKVANLRTFQADFEQRVHNENGREMDLSSGIFSIERPNHFRWEVKQAYEQLIVGDGEHIFTYDPDLEQVTVQNQSKLLADSPLLLMTSDITELTQSFDITQVDIEGKPEHQLFSLAPKHQGGVFESIKVLFDGEKMIELLMADTLGQQTSVQFTNVQINQKLDVSLFSFIMPEGVDVVDSRVAEVVDEEVDVDVQSEVLEEKKD